MKTCLFMIVSLNLFRHAECINPDANLGQLIDSNDPNTQQETDQKIQKLFEELQAAKSEMFDFFLNEEDDFVKLEIHIQDIYKIAEEIAQFSSADESNPISRAMKSYTDSITIPHGLKSIFFAPNPKDITQSFFSYTKAVTRLKHYMGLFLSTMNSMAEKLHNKSIFDENLKKEIDATFDIANSGLDPVDVSKPKEEVIAKVEEYKLENLKYIFQLINLKLLSGRSVIKDKHQIDSFFNFVIRESIFLDYKLEMTISSIRTSSFDMFESLLSNLEESYNLLFAFFFHSLYHKNNLEEKTKDKEIDFDPIRELIYFFSDTKKMSKYLRMKDDLVKHNFAISIDIIFCDIKLLEFLKGESPGENEAFKSFKMLQNRLNELFYCIDHFKILELRLSPNSENLDQNLLIKFAEKIGSLINVLVDDSLSKGGIELLLAEQIQNLLNISKQESALHSSEMLERVPRLLSRYLKNELIRLCYAIGTESYKSIDQLKEHLKPRIEKLCFRRPIKYENLSIIKESNETVSPSSNLKFYSDLLEDFEELNSFETALASKYRGLIKEAKSILSEILYFSPNKDKINDISEYYPLQQKMDSIEQSLADLREDSRENISDSERRARIKARTEARRRARRIARRRAREASNISSPIFI